MTRLPEKELLSGAKMPRTTTGEMKNALGKLRDYLAELFGDDSADKESARKTLGIDLTELASKPEVEKALSEKAEKRELDVLEEALFKRGTPIGTIDYFAMASPPAGYLKADGVAVGRETYPELFTAIGTTYGEGDGSTTFNLPDLINRFAQGSNMPGQKIEAGLPTFQATLISRPFGDNANPGNVWGIGNAALTKVASGDIILNGGLGSQTSRGDITTIDPSRSNSIYGASNTVQPPALTLLPCIKAFDAASNPGLIDVTALAADLNTKLDKAGGRMNGAIYFGESGYTGVGYDDYGQIVLTSKGGASPASLALSNDGHLWTNNRQIHYVTEANNNGTNWYRKWSDGWLEQGGRISIPGNNGITVTLMHPYSSFFNAVASPLTNNTIFYQGNPISVNTASLTTLSIGAYGGAAGTMISWQASGR